MAANALETSRIPVPGIQSEAIREELILMHPTLVL